MSVVVTGRASGNDRLNRHGRLHRGELCYCCREWHCCFYLNYRNEANKVDVPKKIIEMALNGSGIRDTAQVLGVSKNTVLTHLKNSSRRP